MKDPRKIPHRFREEAFNRYASHIARAFEVYPEIVAIEPVSVTPAVFAQGVRDAMTGKDLYGWTWPSLNESRYQTFRDNMTASVQGGVVVLGPPQAIRKALKARHLTMSTTQPTVKVNLTPDRAYAILHMLCQLISTGAVEAVRYEVHGMIWEHTAALETTFPDVVIKPVVGQPGTAIIL